MASPDPVLQPIAYRLFHLLVHTAASVRLFCNSPGEILFFFFKAPSYPYTSPSGCCLMIDLLVSAFLCSRNPLLLYPTDQVLLDFQSFYVF